MNNEQLELQKIMFIDIETTGLDPKRNEIIELAAVLTIFNIKTLKYQTIDKFHIKIKPLRTKEISQRALDIQDLTIEDFEKPEYLNPITAFLKITDKFSEWSNNEDPRNKMLMAGYNVITFDSAFLRNFFKEYGDEKTQFSRWFHRGVQDIYHQVVSSYALFSHYDKFPKREALKEYEENGEPKIKKIIKTSFTLSDICKHWGIEIKNVHTAQGDVNATIKVAEFLHSMIRKKIEVKRSDFGYR